MANHEISDILLDRWNGYDFGATLSTLANNDDRNWRYHGNACYFFLKKELDVASDNWDAAKRRGDIRHCKPYRGQFMDYVVKKNFDTLEEWAADAGGSLDDVLYGTNRVHKQLWLLQDGTHTYTRQAGTPMYVELNVLLTHLGYTRPPPVEVPAFRDIDVDELTAQMGRLMTERDLSIKNVWVIANGTPTQWTQFMNQ